MTAPRKRRIRGKRAKGRPVVITTRDVEMLICISLTGYLDTEQLAREFFAGSVDRCRRRVRQLFDAGYVEIHILSSTRFALISVSREGIAVLREHALAVAVHARPRTAIKVAGVAHHLGIVDARLYVAALAVSDGSTLLAWSNTGGPLHQAMHLRETHGLVPDAIFEIGDRTANHSNTDSTNSDHGNTTVALEVDTGSEAMAGTGDDSIVRKLDKYASVFTAQGADGLELDELWVLVTAEVGLGRLEHLRRRVMAAGLGDVTRLFAHAHVRRRPVLPPPARVDGRGMERTHSPPQSMSAVPPLPPRDRAVRPHDPARGRMADGRADRRVS